LLKNKIKGIKVKVFISKISHLKKRDGVEVIIVILMAIDKQQKKRTGSSYNQRGEWFHL
jgi:hypothetical protein